MPLSQDFTNSRLEYLQSSLKNDNIIATQFYPRFQRHYNEMFPFTEGSLTPSIIKQDNPQQPVISSALNPTLDMVKENLKTFLIPYVGDQANTVIKFLSDAQKYYYEQNFEQIQKELLKQIKIPTSIESYLANLKMVLNNDKNRSNLSVLEPVISNSKTNTPIEKKQKTSIFQTPAQSKTRPLTEYFTASTRKQLAPPLQIRKIKTEASSPRKNLKLAMTKTRRSESDNLLHDTNNILNPSKAPARLFDPVLVAELGGFGYKKNVRFVGRGIQTREIKHKKEFHRYAIDLKKLHHNVLALKYLKNANNVATFKPIQISDSFKEIIENFLYDGEKINEADFNSLSITEKRILKRLYSFLKIDFDFDYSDDFQNRFQVMYGSFLAGNDSHLLKRELKEYIKLAVHEAIISEREGNQMLQKLDK